MDLLDHPCECTNERKIAVRMLCFEYNTKGIVPALMYCTRAADCSKYSIRMNQSNNRESIPLRLLEERMCRFYRIVQYSFKFTKLP
mmetsp:Transcript_11217/g.23698  ORF Transcript_11217/g.23698 Transcript_11217/m.23698 type:complete len:86 (+) Transcript_11217:1766-2023(+)